MYLMISKKSRRTQRRKSARFAGRLKAKNRRRVNGMRGRKLGRRIGKVGKKG
jgi:hypothetical protein